MSDAIARVLAFFYQQPVVGGSIGFAIILLTGAVMTLLLPLTLRATRSQIKMQEMQPKLKDLQRRHKDDKQTLNAEMMKLYQEEGINPVGGCLPMLAQLPVLFVMFNVLRGLSRTVAQTPFYTVAEHARSEAGLPAIVGETFDPKYLDHGSKMYQDLSGVTEMSFGPFDLFDLSAHALDVIRSDIFGSIPYLLLIAFVVATSYYQQRQISSRRTSTVAVNPQQEMILKVMPLMTGVWSFGFPAGLVLYWATSNVFRIGQQAYITRAYYGQLDEAERREDGPDEGEEPEPEPKPSSNGTEARSGGRRPSGRGRKPAGEAEAANGSASDEPAEPAAVGGGDRNDAWERRRRERARAREVSKNRSGESSRVTPKGTKPSGSKKKRKR